MCKAKQYSDQMVCDACMKSWDMNDPYRSPCTLATDLNPKPTRRFVNLLFLWGAPVCIPLVLYAVTFDSDCLDPKKYRPPILLAYSVYIVFTFWISSYDNPIRKDISED